MCTVHKCNYCYHVAVYQHGERSAHGTGLSISQSLCVSVCMSVRLTIQRVYYGKTAEGIRMPFELLSVVGEGMGVLHGLVIGAGEGPVLEGEFGSCQCNQLDLCNALL